MKILTVFDGKEVTMGALFSMRNLLVVWSVFYLFCHAIGRPEVPVTLIWRLHHKVMSGIDKPWGWV